METKENVKKKGKRSVSVLTVFIWLALIVVMSVITINSVSKSNALEGTTYTLTFNSGKGTFSDGSTEKYLTVVAGTEITMEYLESQGIVATDSEGNEVKTWTLDSSRRINTKGESIVASFNSWLGADYGSYTVDFVVFTYDGENLTEEKVSSINDMLYGEIVGNNIPVLEEKEGYTLIDWRSSYDEDPNCGVNLLDYSTISERTPIYNNKAYYALYFKNGSGKLSEVYLGDGYDSNSGDSLEESVYSFTRAKQLLAKDATIYITDTKYIDSWQSDSDRNVSLEGYGNAKIMRHENCNEYLFEIEGDVTFSNVTIDGGNKVGLKGDRGLICISNYGTLTLGNGVVLENSTLSYKYSYTTSYKNTEVDGGAAILAKLGGNVIVEEGAIIRNNNVELNIYELNIVEVNDIADIDLMQNKVYKYTLDNATNLKLIFKLCGRDHGYLNCAIYDENFSLIREINDLIYYESTYNETESSVYVPGNTVYIVPNVTKYSSMEDDILDNNEGIIVSSIEDYTEDVEAVEPTSRLGILGGGAIALDNTGSTMIMNGGEIYGNSSYWGGAIYCGPQNQLTINGGKIHDNDASYGGAIYIEEHGYTYEATEEGLIQTEKNYNTVDTIINGGEIYNNTAEVDGGAVYVESSTFKLNGGNIYSNTAGNQGGGVYVGNGYTAQNDITTTFEMMGGNIYSNTAYVGGGIYNAGTCALKAGNIYDNNVTKENEATGSTYASYKNYGGSAVYAYEDVIMYPEIRINGDVRVCVDEGANIVLPEGFEGYSEYNNPDKTTIDVSVEEYIAHEDYAIVRADNSKEDNTLTEEQINCPEKAVLSETGRSEDNRVVEDKVVAKKSIFATIEEIVKRIAEIFKNEYKLTESDLAKFDYYGDYGWGVKLDKATNQLELTKTKEITKIWNDDNDSEGVRPDSVKLEIYKDGNEYGTVTVSKKDNWTYKLYETGRADYDEEEPVFTVVEKDLPEDYIAEVVEKTDGNIEVQNTLVDISKTVDVGDGAYVKTGEELEYTLTYKNNNPYGELVTITDSIPKGAKYIEGSMTVEINGKNAKDKFEMAENTTGELVWKTKDGEVLASGEKVSVSFKVKVLTVEEGLNTDKITNKGKVTHGETIDTQKEDETNEVKNTVENDPIKEVNVGDGKEAKTGEEITYVVTYNNLEEGKVKITDSIPEGTKYVSGSMTVEINGKNAKNTFDIIELSNGATNGELVWETKEGKTVPESSVITVSFKVKVLTTEEGLTVDKITNKAKVTHEGTVSGVTTTKDTNEVENKVVIEEVDTSDINVGKYVAISLIAIVGIAFVVILITKNNKKKKINN